MIVILVGPALFLANLADIIDDSLVMHNAVVVFVVSVVILVIVVDFCVVVVCIIDTTVVIVVSGARFEITARFLVLLFVLKGTILDAAICASPFSSVF